MNIEHYYLSLFTIYSKIVTATMILPIIVAAWHWRKLNHSLRIFDFYLIGDLFLALFMQVFIWATGAFKTFFVPILAKLNIKDTNFVSIVDYLFTFLMLGWYFSNVFDSVQNRRRIRVITIALTLFAIIHNFFIVDWREYNSVIATLFSFFCMLMPLIHFWFVYRTLTEVTVQRNPYFWINLGLLVPNSLGLFLHFSGNKLYESDVALYYQVSIVKYYFVILAQFFFAYSFYLSRNAKYLPEKW